MTPFTWDRRTFRKGCPFLSGGTVGNQAMWGQSGATRINPTSLVWTWQRNDWRREYGGKAKGFARLSHTRGGTSFCRETNRWKNVDSLEKKKKVVFCPVCYDNDKVPLQTQQNLLECQDDSLQLQHLQ